MKLKMSYLCYLLIADDIPLGCDPDQIARMGAGDQAIWVDPSLETVRCLLRLSHEATRTLYQKPNSPRRNNDLAVLRQAIARQEKYIRFLELREIRE